MTETAPRLEAYDDIYVKSNDLSAQRGPTMIALAHNETYMLPAWLRHYRNLGITRFIVLDDASNDGTLEILRDQPDVMVVGSRRRYGETVPVLDRLVPGGTTVAQRRMVHVWRMVLYEKYALDDWVAMMDFDEFLILPEGLDFGAVFRQLQDSPHDAVAGVMLDSYPRDIAALKSQTSRTQFDYSDEWFFDACPHHVQRQGTFKVVYPGSRSRLMQEHDVLSRDLGIFGRAFDFAKMLRRVASGRPRISMVNDITKYPLVRWRAGSWMNSSHHVSVPVSPVHYLPILHMKFTGDLYRRSENAIREKSYFKGSIGYVRLMSLLATMDEKQASFLGPASASIHDLRAFARAGMFAGFSDG